MKRYVLDTNIVSLIVKRDLRVIARYDAETTDEDELILCPMVWYEARCGLIAKGATSQINRFNALVNTFVWQDYTPDDWLLASQLWAKRRASGTPIADADLLIAVFALNRSAVLVTNNEKDFINLGVMVENWAAA